MKIAETNWNALIRDLPGAHFLQTNQWAEVKAPLGWMSEQRVWKDDNGRIVAAAQVLFRTQHLFRSSLKFTVGYIPRGPLLDWGDIALRNRVMTDLMQMAKERKVIFLKMDPELLIGNGIPGSDTDQLDPTGKSVSKELQTAGWKPSVEQVQFMNTVYLDLDGSEEDWLKCMKQKTRYNLRLAQRSGVTVRKATREDLPLLYLMYAETANRDGFIIRPEQYYLDVWSKFINAHLAEGLIAEVDGIAIAGLVVFFFGNRSWYVYGMSTQNNREKMPNYLLQWEAMRIAKEHGCSYYDLWGAPDQFDKSDPMYGVYRFKEGLGGRVVRFSSAWDYPCKPGLYFLYQKVLPRILSLTRMVRRRQIKQEVM